MNKKIRYYLTWNEFLTDFSPSIDIAEFNTLLNSVTIENVDLDSRFEEVWVTIYHKHFNDYVAYLDKCLLLDVPFDEQDPAVIDYKDKTDNFLRQFAAIYQCTSDRYIQLIKFYDANKSELLNKISSSTKTKFNDTPQSTGDYTTDDYTSTYTEVTSEADTAPLMAKLDEIYKAYKNLIADWAREFDRLFILGGINDYE